MEIYLIVLFFIMGAALGSFINVLVDRLPNDKSLISPPSHCDACQRRLSALELIPVVSYIALRGRCRYCGAKIPLRVMLVEMVCGLWLAFLFWYQGLNADFAMIALFSFVFIVIALIDLKYQLVLSAVILPAIVIALVLDGFVIERGIINSLIGAGVGAVIILIPYLVTRGAGMGFGDVEIAFLIGLVTGFSKVLTAIFGGIILGGLVAIFLLIFRIKGRKEAIPFGPFLSLAGIITLLWGSNIMDWWLGIFSR